MVVGPVGSCSGHCAVVQGELHVSFPLIADGPHLQFTCRAKASELVGRAGGAAEETAESARRAAKEAAPDELAAR